MVDVVLVSLLILLSLSLSDAVFGPALRLDLHTVTFDDGLVVVNATFSVLLSAAYFVVSWITFGASPGQMLLNLRVRRAGDSARLKTGQALLRWLLLFPPFGIAAALLTSVSELGALVWASAPLWYLILLATTTLSPTRQGLHDRLTRTVVDERTRGVALPEKTTDVR